MARHPRSAAAVTLGPTVTLTVPGGTASLAVGTVYIVQWPDGARQPVRILAEAVPQPDGCLAIHALLLPREGDDGLAP